MWSHFGQGSTNDPPGDRNNRFAPPPSQRPPPGNVSGTPRHFPPPGPPPPQQQQPLPSTSSITPAGPRQFHPPPAPAATQSFFDNPSRPAFDTNDDHDDHDGHDDYDDDGEGALGATINLVTSAASMFFKAASRPSQQPPVPVAAAPPPPPIAAPAPPAPIESISSMLEDSDMMVMNTATEAAAPSPIGQVLNNGERSSAGAHASSRTMFRPPSQPPTPTAPIRFQPPRPSSHSPAMTPSLRPPVPPEPTTTVKPLSTVTASVPVFGLAKSPRIAGPSSPGMLVPPLSPVVMTTSTRPLLPNLNHSSGAAIAVPPPIQQNPIGAETPASPRPPFMASNLAFRAQSNLGAGVGVGAGSSVLASRLPPPEVPPPALPPASTPTVASSPARVPPTPQVPSSASDVFAFSGPPPTPTRMTMTSATLTPVTTASAGTPPPIPLPVPRVKAVSSTPTGTAPAVFGAATGTTIPPPSARSATPPVSPMHRWPASIPMTSSTDVTKIGGDGCENNNEAQAVTATPKPKGSVPFPPVEEPPSSPLTPLITNLTMASSMVANASAAPPLGPALTRAALGEASQGGQPEQAPPMGIAASTLARTVTDRVADTNTTIRSTPSPAVRRGLRVPPPSTIPSHPPNPGFTANVSATPSRPKFRLPTPRKRIMPVAAVNPGQKTQDKETVDATIATDIPCKVPPTLDEDIVAATGPGLSKVSVPPSSTQVGSDTVVVVETPAASLAVPKPMESISPTQVKQAVADVVAPPPSDNFDQDLLTTATEGMNTPSPTISKPPSEDYAVSEPALATPSPGPSLVTPSMDRTDGLEPEDLPLVDARTRQSALPSSMREETAPTVPVSVAPAFLQPPPAMDTERNPEETSSTDIVPTTDDERVEQDDCDENLPSPSGGETTPISGFDISPDGDATLPDGWSEIADPNSGQVYYYNSFTLETSWERPRQEPSVAEGGVDETQPPTTADESDTSSAAAAIDSTLDLLNAEFGLDTDGTEEYETMPTSRLENIRQAPQEGEEDDTTHDSAESLPIEEGDDVPYDDWVEVNDPTSGNTYYYHRITGETSWDKPSAPETTLEEENCSPTNPESEPESTTGNGDGDHCTVLEPETEMEADTNAEPEDLDAQIDDMLPTGWTELVDPSTGQSYYYNQMTEETSWTRPSSMELSAVGEATPTDNDANNLQQEEPESAKYEQNDSNSEENLDTEPEVPETTLGQTELSTTSAVLGPSIEQEGETYSCANNEGEIVDEMPITDGFTTEKDTETEAAASVAESALSVESDTDSPREDSQPLGGNFDGVDSNRKVEDPLPDDWVETSDPATGQSYFYNSVSGESTWERPKPDTSSMEEKESSSFSSEKISPIPDHSESHPEIPQMSEETSVTDADELPDKFGADLPIGWEECEDPDSGQIYYYNGSTGESSWERPSLPHEQRRETESAESCEDDSDETYDVHPEIHATTLGKHAGNPTVDNSIHDDVHVTGPTSLTSGEVPSNGSEQRSLERPTVTDYSESDNRFESVTNDDITKVNSHQSAESCSSRVEDSDGMQEQSATTTAENDVGSQRTDQGWVEVVDESTGQVYFYHPESKEVSWERPVADSSIEAGDLDAEGDEVMTETEAKGISEPTSEIDVESEEALSDELNIADDHVADGWVEAFDPSGKVYYYHSLTGDVTWERPETSPETSLHGTEPEEENGAYVASSTHVATSIVGKEDADESEAPINQRSDIHHGRDFEAEHLDGFEESVGGGNVLPDEPEKVSQLVAPEVYLRNVKTDEDLSKSPAHNLKESTCENTITDVAGDDDDDEHSSDQLVGEVETDEQSKVIPLFPDWDEAVDGTSGQTYYYNRVTGETTWEWPPTSSGNGDDTVESTTEREDAGEIVVSSAVSLENHNDKEEPVDRDTVPYGEELPHDWVEAWDPSSGNAYYVNSVTGESTWERPTRHAESSEDVDKDGPESKEDSSMAEKEPESQSDSVAEDNSQGEEFERAIPNEGQLPEGWSEEQDPSSGKTYFYNSVTNEIQWERESIGIDASRFEGPEEHQSMTESRLLVGAEPDENSEERDEGIKSQEAEMEEDMISNKPLPEGWIREFDVASGCFYYFNQLTGVTSWEIPYDIEPEVEQDDVSPADEPCVDQDSKDIIFSEMSSQVIQNVATVHSVGDSELPEGWEEVSGPTRVYYYHERTGETSWEKPTSSLQQSQEKLCESKDPSFDLDHAVESSLQSEPEIENEEKYAVLARKDLPSSEEISPETLKMTAETEVVSDELLPEGWEKASDPSDGSVYYYHVVTGETSWEKPPSCPVQPNGQDHELKDPSHGRDNPIEKRTQSEPEMVNQENDIDIQVNRQLPGGREKISDPSNDQIYSENTVTLEEHEDLPVSESDLADNQEVEATEELLFLADEFREQQIVETDDDEALPEAWSKVTDPTTNQVYYYNETTGETSWDAPSPIDAGKPKRDEGDDDELEVVLADSKISIANESSSKHTVRNDPDALAGSGEASLPREHPVDSHHNQNQKDADDLLPDGWIEVLDEVSGKLYYYHEESGETSWEKPGHISKTHALPVEGKREIEAEGDAAETQQARAEKVESTSDKNDITDGWEDVVDHSEGDINRYKPDAGETSVTEPGLHPEHISMDQQYGNGLFDNDTRDGAKTIIQDDWVDVGAASPIEVKGASSDEKTLHEIEGENDLPLQTNWIEVTDPSTNEKYYYNEVTEETRWERPSVVLAEQRENVEHEYPARLEDETGTYLQDDADKPWEHVHELELDSSLPEFWTEAEDPSSGKKYYFNTITQITSWERPTGSTSGASNTSNNPGTSELEDSLEGPMPSTLEKEEKVFEQVGNIMVTAVSVEKLEREIAAIGASGPFAYADDAVVLELIGKKAKTADILWQLIEIAVRSDGRLRSDGGVIDKTSPESAIVELLLQDDNGGIATDSSKPNRHVLLKQKRNPDGGDSIQRVEDLLLRGQRLKAVDEAMAIGNFATALLVASMCDTFTYKRVARTYAEQTFATASPMYTTAVLFSESLEAPSSRRPGNWGIHPSELKQTWKSHLAAIISNRRDGWDNIVLSLGDRLREIGLVMEAHFCYMVCGCPISKPTDPLSRIALLGCDHSDPKNIVLMTEESLTAYERTEAYEWAKRKGNRNASFRSFQPFKLIYSMLLADFGQIEKAKSFIMSIRLSDGVVPVHLPETRYVVVNDMFDDESAFALVCDETRRQLFSKQGLATKYSQSFLKGEAMVIPIGPNSSIIGADSYPDVQLKVPKPQRHDDSLQRDSLSSEHTGVLTPAKTVQVNADPQTSLLDPDSSFLSAKSNLMDVTAYSLDMPVVRKSNETAAQTHLLAPVEEIPVVPAQGHTPESPPLAMPARPAVPEMEKTRSDVKAANAKTQPPHVASTPQEQKRPKAAPSTAPPVMMGKKAKIPRTPAPSSGGGGLGLSTLRSWVIKKFNPDATECHLPEDSGGMYFDKDLKCWIFPGDDPAQVAKPLSPPPMAPKAGTPLAAPTDGPDNDSSKGSHKQVTPNDPLAAMMAPPSRAPSAVNRSGYGRSAGMPKSGHYNPGMTALRGPSTELLSPAPGPVPQFAVFTPNPIAKGDQDSASNMNTED